jgi:LysR family transcriptional regulator, glycine cleavage system transcriptional activator
MRGKLGACFNLEKRNICKSAFNEIQRKTMNRPPLHALQGFVAAARLGNLSRAAESLHLTVSALSHQIKALEERLGYRLFVRGSRGIALTDDGRRLLERIAPHLAAIEQALRPFTARRDEVLTISLIPSMASAWLIPRLSRFLGAHPQLEFSLRSTAELVDFDRDPDIDAALRSGGGRWPGLIAEHLFDEALVPVASPTLLQRLHTELGTPTLGDLYRWPLLGDPGGYWDRWFAHYETPRPARYVAGFDDGDAMQRAAVEGVGIGLARITRAQPLLDSGLLRPLVAERLHTDYAHYLVYPQRSQDHEGLRAFREWLLEEARIYTAEVSSTAARDDEKRNG